MNHRAQKQHRTGGGAASRRGDFCSQQVLPVYNPRVAAVAAIAATAATATAVTVIAFMSVQSRHSRSKPEFIFILIFLVPPCDPKRRIVSVRQASNELTLLFPPVFPERPRLISILPCSQMARAERLRLSRLRDTSLHRCIAQSRPLPRRPLRAFTSRTDAVDCKYLKSCLTRSYDATAGCSDQRSNE